MKSGKIMTEGKLKKKGIVIYFLTFPLSSEKIKASIGTIKIGLN